MKKTILILPILFTNLLCIATETDSLFTLSLQELTRIDVTGSTLTPKKLKVVPSAVTVFTDEEISRIGLDSLDELMNLVPGFQSYRSSASSLNYPYSSRGRSIGSNGAEILILVDGQRLNDPRTSGSVLVVPKFPLAYIKRVEFIRGPGATIYGSNAMMGIINIVTRSDVNEVSGGYGSFDRRQAYFLGSQKFNDVTVDLLGRFDEDNGEEYHAQDGFNNNNVETDDPRKLADLNIKVGWKATSLVLQHYQSDVEDFYITNRLSNGFNQRESKFTSVSLKQEFQWKSIKSSISLGYSYVDVQSYGQLTAPGSLTAISDPASNDALFASPEFDNYNEARLLWSNDWDIDLLSSLQFGIELRRIDAPEAVAKNNFDIGELASGNLPVNYYGALLATTPVQAESNREVVGLYGQYQRQLLKSTQLTLGLRYDHFSSIGAQLSPRIGLVQELNDNQSLKLLYGEAFRAPSESELNLINNPVFLGNTDLDSETVQSWDLIWVGQWSRTNVSIGYFESHFKDSIVQINTEGGLLKYQNTDLNPTKGAELEFYCELNENVLLRTTFTRIFTKTDSAFREADTLFSCMLNYQKNKWNANLIATYSGERESPFTDGDGKRTELNDYWQFSAKLSYNINLDWKIFLQAKNLLDEDYRTPPASSNLSDGVQNRGREALIGVTWRY